VKPPFLDPSPRSWVTNALTRAMRFWGVSKMGLPTATPARSWTKRMPTTTTTVPTTRRFHLLGLCKVRAFCPPLLRWTVSSSRNSFRRSTWRWRSIIFWARTRRAISSRMNKRPRCSGTVQTSGVKKRNAQEKKRKEEEESWPPCWEENREKNKALFCRVYSNGVRSFVKWERVGMVKTEE